MTAPSFRPEYVSSDRLPAPGFRNSVHLDRGNGPLRADGYAKA